MKARYKEDSIVLGDCLGVMQGLCEQHPAGFADLVYIDPPFNTGRVQVGSKGHSFDDRWDDVSKQELEQLRTHSADLADLVCSFGMYGSPGTLAYLVYLGLRLVWVEKVLKKTGSIYVHLDYRVNYCVRAVMDAVFGYRSLRNEIVWCYTGPSCTKKFFARKHDTILFYTKSQDYVFNTDLVRVPYKEPCRGWPKWGSTPEELQEINAKGKVLEDFWTDIGIAGKDHGEAMGYPTQKPKKLLGRIISASSKEGDIVADFFCGSGTTCVVAQELGRQWFGCDISELAVGMAQERISKQVALV